MRVIVIEDVVYKVTEAQFEEIKKVDNDDENALLELLESRKKEYIEVGPIWFSFRA